MVGNKHDNRLIREIHCIQGTKHLPNLSNAMTSAAERASAEAETSMPLHLVTIRNVGKTHTCGVPSPNGAVRVRCGAGAVSLNAYRRPDRRILN